MTCYHTYAFQLINDKNGEGGDREGEKRAENMGESTKKTDQCSFEIGKAFHAPTTRMISQVWRDKELRH